MVPLKVSQKLSRLSECTLYAPPVAIQQHQSIESKNIAGTVLNNKHLNLSIKQI